LTGQNKSSRTDDEPMLGAIRTEYDIGIQQDKPDKDHQSKKGRKWWVDKQQNIHIPSKVIGCTFTFFSLRKIIISQK
jgi:hypothetical protein